MQRGTGEEPTGTRGGTAWNDGLYPIDGGSSGDVPSFIATTKDLSAGLGGSTGRGTASVPEKAWFASVETDDTLKMECKDGVCPVPWAVKEATPVVQLDQVNHPPHYTDGGIETIEAIEAQLSQEEYEGYLRGNCVKYLWRWRNKGGVQDLEKCRWYLDRLIQTQEV